MNICWRRLGGMILSIVIYFLATAVCQDHKWTGYHYQYHPSTTLWQRSSLSNQGTTAQDLLLQNSIRRPMRWLDPLSKPQWKIPMYKTKWQDPFSKPQWQASKVLRSKPSSKPFKNAVDGQWSDRFRKQWRPIKFNFMSFRKTTPAPRMNAQGSWPEYIPPLSVIRPSLDDPHALLNWS